MPLHKRKNNSGVILIIVLVILMILSIVSVTIFSQSLTQTKTSHSQVDQIVTEQLAKGAFWVAANRATQQAISGGIIPYDGPNTITSDVLNGRTYSATVEIKDPGTIDPLNPQPNVLVNSVN